MDHCKPLFHLFSPTQKDLLDWTSTTRFDIGHGPCDFVVGETPCVCIGWTRGAALEDKPLLCFFLFKQMTEGIGYGDKNGQRTILHIGDIIETKTTDSCVGMIVFIEAPNYVYLFVHDDKHYCVRILRSGFYKMKILDRSRTEEQEEIYSMVLARTLEECKESSSNHVQTLVSIFASYEGLDFPAKSGSSVKMTRSKRPLGCGPTCERIILQPGHRIRFLQDGKPKTGVVLSVLDDLVEVEEDEQHQVLTTPAGMSRIEVIGVSLKHSALLSPPNQRIVAYGLQGSKKQMLDVGFRVRFQVAGESREGIIILILHGGHLRIQDASGEIHRVRSGKIHIL